MMNARETRADAAKQRDQFIPVRKTDVLDALVEHGAFGGEAERDEFRQVCRMLAAIYHYEYFDELEQLRHSYFYFNPELDQRARIDVATLERNYAALLAAFTAVLKGANFIEMSHAEVEQAHRERKVTRVEVVAPVDDFREIRFFRRGHHTETAEISEWYGLRKRSIETLVYDDVVLLVAMKPEADAGGSRRRKWGTQRKVRAGAVLIKYFRNIASTDLNALFPDVRVVMSTSDKLFLGVPALAGGLPILLNLASTVTVLFLVAGFYVGIVAAVEHDQMKTALAAMSGLVALVAFVMRQWLRYERQSLKYQKELTDNIYFHNVNNNAGIFDYMIGAAEEQECKEAFLAYYFLRTATAPLTQAELDARIEQWLVATFAIELDFEVDDALAKLERLGLLVRDGERLSVPPPKETLTRLDRVWDDYFQFSAARVAAEVP